MSKLTNNVDANGHWMYGPITTNDESIHDPRDGYNTVANFGPLVHMDILWHRGSIMPGGMFAGVDGVSGPVDNMAYKYDMWTWLTRTGGTQDRVAIVGTVLTGAGVPVPGVTVKLFDTATGTLVDTQTTDAAGAYDVGSPYANANSFAVAYLPGSPDQAGTTVNTLPG